MVGSIGDLNFYSFHNKLIASGEGGMITTNDKNLADRSDKLKNPPQLIDQKKEMVSLKSQ